jgi:tripartite-type tricarboxylate transporter receptor subunit TctC
MKNKTSMAIAALVATVAVNVNAQSKTDEFPSRTVNLIVPYAPGGATDVIARTVAQKLAEQWGQPVVVENRAGGNGNIGASLVAKAQADGYTLLMATSSHAINATLYKKLNYDFGKDFAALSNIASVPLVLVVHPGVPATSPKELSAYAGARPGVLNFGSGGVGTAAHLAGELFNVSSKAQMMHVAYKGGAPAITDLMGGQIQVMFANLPEVMAQIKTGKLRALAVTGDSRHPQQPDVPTFSQSGVTGIELKSWFGILAPKDTPPAIVNRLSTDIAKAVAHPDVQARLKQLGGEPIGNTHAQFQPYLIKDIERWGSIVKQSGASAD